ncbi:MAG TPA: M67 family metallopeptidase [Vicinamibacterales bacterium]|nr:M67 family metallopeptidase [Vicinamibacterales bacterium]
MHAAIVAHARRDAPDECCGFLLGADDAVDEACPARNLTRSPTRFLVDPEDHFAAIHRARATGRAVRAVYHSHPSGPPRPSASDAAEMRDPELIYVIVSLAPEVTVSAWQWVEERFVEVRLVVS